jgi:NADPH-dependent 2,4-dienoyl-CoA reductase/sulfur reductase-like enzyme
MKPVVIVGAGHAGVAAAAALREEKYSGPIVLVSDESHPPYQRPPLSKAYLKGSLSRESLVLRGLAFYGNQRIDTILGDRVDHIDRAGSQVGFASGRRIAYEHLVLLLGIGVSAEDRLAQECGVVCDNGIRVDAQMRTSDAHVSAVGDCCSHPNIWHGGDLRLESVQNATDQAVSLPNGL